MTWTRPADLKTALTRLWARGDLLRETITAQSRFPLRIPLRTPGTADLTDRFDAVRAWVVEWTAAPELELEWQEFRHRVQGGQRLPTGVWIKTRAQALARLGKRRDAERFEVLVEQTRIAHPELLPWLEQRPLVALERAEDWPRLLAVVGWVKDHPRPGCYLRQVDLPGVHTKFIEARRGILAELLDRVLPPTVLDPTQSGVARFAARYGFRDKPTRIRLRVLDPQIALVSGPPHPDLALDAASFAALRVDLERVFITENETNFLAFPDLPRAIVLFGAGYGWEALAQARWLQDCALHYWGDIDTHGFAILDQLRQHFPQARSFLMDRDTLIAHRALWGTEPEPVAHDLPHLTAREAALYDELRDQRLGHRLRLEQELIGYDRVLAAVLGCPHEPTTGPRERDQPSGRSGIGL